MTPVIGHGEVLHGQGFVFGASFFLLLFILELVRRKKIGERFSLLWIVVTVGMCLAASVGFPYLFQVAPLIGVIYPATALFLLAFLGLLILSIYFTIILSQLAHQNRILAQRIVLLEGEGLKSLEASGKPNGE